MPARAAGRNRDTRTRAQDRVHIPTTINIEMCTGVMFSVVNVINTVVNVVNIVLLLN